MDASTDGWYFDLPGIGIYNFSNHQYVSCTPPDHLRHLPIADLELLAHIVTANVWGAEWNGAHVEGFTDSSACFYLLSNGKSRYDIRLRMARFFAMCQVKLEFHWKTNWISTLENILPDALSRIGSEKYRQIFKTHSDNLGDIPRERLVSPDMFNFGL